MPNAARHRHPSRPKAKINFEVDSAVLANARAYAVLHSTSLNKLVSALFAGLGQIGRHQAPMADPTKRILLDLSSGKSSLLEATDLLGLPDAGYTLRRLSDEGLPLPHLSLDDAQQQADETFDALAACLVVDAGTALPFPAPKTRRRAAAR